MKQISELLRNLHEDKSIYSFFILGYIYEKGELVPQDYIKSSEYYGIAASMDAIETDVIAMGCKGSSAYNLLIFHIFGHINILDQEQITLLIKISEKFGGREIFYGLGVMHEKGFLVKQSYSEAFKYYHASSEMKHSEATFRLGMLYDCGDGCSVDKVKAKKLYENAHIHGSKNPEFIFYSNWIDNWPNPNWLTNNEIGSIGKIYGGKSGMDKLKSAIDIYDTRISNEQDFSIERDCSNPRIVDPQILFWLRMVSRRGIGEGSYEVAKYCFSRLNTYNASTNSIAYFFGFKSNVKSYVKLYLWTLSCLHRAKDNGINVGNVYWNDIKLHEKIINNKYSAILDECIEYIVNDEEIWDKVDDLCSKDFKFRLQPQKMLTTVPIIRPDELIPELIITSNINEYKIYSLLIIDQKQLKEFHKQFFIQAVKSKKLKLAANFLSGHHFDTNYIIDGTSISPLELMIIESDLEEIKKFISRPDVDVNFNLPIFTAALQGRSDVVQLLLKHPDIDISCKKETNGKQLSLEEFAILYKLGVIIWIIRDFQKTKTSNANPKAGNDASQLLYFQYRNNKQQQSEILPQSGQSEHKSTNKSNSLYC